MYWCAEKAPVADAALNHRCGLDGLLLHHGRQRSAAYGCAVAAVVECGIDLFVAH